NNAGIGIAEWTMDLHGVGSGSAQGLKIVARLAQMHGVRSDVAHLENPLLAEGTLHRQVPLLCVGHNKVPRHLQPENVRGQERAWASASGCWSVHGVLRSIG